MRQHPARALRTSAPAAGLLNATSTSSSTSSRHAKPNSNALNSKPQRGSNHRGISGGAKAQLEDLQNQREHILTQDGELITTISHQTQELEGLEVAVEQRGTLITQYDADIARLDLQLQGMRHDQTHPHPDTCQFCHSTIATPSPTDEDIAAFETEIARIQRLKEEATDDLDPYAKSQPTLPLTLGTTSKHMSSC